MAAKTTTHLLAGVHRAHRAALAPRLAELGLHPGADLALAELGDRGGITHAELASRLRVKPPSVTKILRTLERDELVYRLVDADDARVSRIHLTPRGRQLRPALQRAWREAEREAFAALSSGEREGLRTLLIKTLRLK